MSEAQPGSASQTARAPRPRGWWLAPVAVVVVALAVIVGRLVIDGDAAVRDAEAAEAKGDQAQAIRRYLDAARLYVPGAPHVRQALDRLQALADTAEKTGDLAEDTRRALEAIRAAILGTRSFFTPHAARLADAERRLAALYAATEDPAVDPGASPEARRAWHAERLARRGGATLGWAVLALLGFALWVGAALWFFSRGMDQTLRLRLGPATASGLLFVFGFALFLVGLRLA